MVSSFTQEELTLIMDTTSALSTANTLHNLKCFADIVKEKDFIKTMTPEQLLDLFILWLDTNIKEIEKKYMDGSKEEEKKDE